MAIPGFLARRLYKKQSLRETAAGRFALEIHNPLSNARLIGPPRFTINGVHYTPSDLLVEGIDVAAITPENPFPFPKGTVVKIGFHGHLLRGANRIHMIVPTKEFGEIDMFVEEPDAGYCEVPTGEDAD